MVATALVGTPVEQTTGTTITVSTTGLSAGADDYLVVFVEHTSATPPAAQSGWTRVLAPPPASQTVSMTAYYQLLAAAAASTYSFPVVSGATSAIPVKVSGADTGTFLDAASTVTAQGLTMSFSQASATTTVADVLALGSMGLNGTSQNITPIPAEVTELDRSAGTGKRQVVYSEARPSIGAIGTRTWTTPGSNVVWVGVRLHIRSAPTAATAALSGSGSLSAGSSPAVAGSAALSGSGSLSGASSSAVARAAALGGAGSLTAGSAPSVARTAALSGSGALAAGSSPNVAPSASLSGSGTLTGSLFGLVDAALSGGGTLAAAQTMAVVRVAVLSGSGSLVAATQLAVVRVANLSGGGTLSGASGIGFARSAALSGAGYLSTWQVNLLRIGGKTVTTLRLGGSMPRHAYLGSTLVWRP